MSSNIDTLKVDQALEAFYSSCCVNPSPSINSKLATLVYGVCYLLNELCKGVELPKLQVDKLDHS